MATGTIKGIIRSEGTINYGTNSYVKYYRVGNVVTLLIYYFVSDGKLTAWSNQVIANLPPELRPKLDLYLQAATDRTTSQGTQFGIWAASGEVFIAARYNALEDRGDGIRGYITYGV